MVSSILYKSSFTSVLPTKECFGIRASSFHNFDITGYEYRLDKLIFGLDTDKGLAAGFFMIKHSCWWFDDGNV